MLAVYDSGQLNISEPQVSSSVKYSLNEISHVKCLIQSLLCNKLTQ